MKGNEIFVCPRCGGDVPGGAVSCPTCGDYLGGKPGPRGGPRDVTCHHCGSLVPKRYRICPKCGVTLRENPQLPAIAPMDLGDIFSATFRLIGRVIARYLLLALLLIVPVSVFFVYGMHRFYAFIGESARTASSASAVDIVRTLLVFALAILLLLLSTTAVKVSLTSMIWDELKGIRLRWAEAMRAGVGIWFLRAIGQMVLATTFMMALLVVPVVLLAAGHGIVVVILMMFAFAAAGAYALYVLIRWSLALPVIVCEDSRVIDSMRRSWLLVEGQWWRAFGILMLFGIITGFAITVVTTPFSMVAMWGFYSEYFKMIATSHGTPPDPEAILRMIASMGRGVGISIVLNLILSTIVTQTYISVLYVDLRARRGELPATAGSASAGRPGTITTRS